MADRSPKETPPKKFSPKLLSKNLVFWLLIILLPIFFFQVYGSGKDEYVDVAYTTFRQELEQNNIRQVEITSGKFIKGEFVHPVILDEGQRVEQFSVVLPIQDSELLLQRLEEKEIPIRAKEPKPGLGTIFIQFLPWIIIIGLWIFFFRQIQQGGNRAFAFGKSKAKMLTGDTPKITFADVAGADEAKVELEEIIEFLKDPQKFQRLGGRLPKGVLLVGPPGTGKTLLARAVAGEASRPFFSMSGSDFVEMFVGVGASRVRDLFEQGKAHAPCLIFIDEIDAVGRHRGAGLGGGHDEREQTLNQLLVEMDGFESNEGVILIAATNRPDVLDPALLRPGRFDRQIVVDMPDVRGREMILKVHCRKIPMSENVNLAILARGTPGLAGADLANIVNEAALLAARRSKNRVDMSDFEDAKDKVMLGIERKSLQLTEEERRLTAYHEAGHAIVSIMIPGQDPVHKVTIVPRGRALGLTLSLPETDRHNHTKDYIHGRLAMAFGGRVAEELIFGADKVTTGAAQDIQLATGMARRMVTEFGMSDVIGPVAVGEPEQQIFLGREFAQRREISERTAETVDEEVKRIIDQAYQRASEILKKNLDLLDRMAAILLERETLGREEVELLKEGKELPPLVTPDLDQPEVKSETPAPTPQPDGGAVLGTPDAEPAGA
ncbi:MAG: ATP-dependent zinc metalloprotease FtsH [Gemmatimonadales bacterium]